MKLPFGGRLLEKGEVKLMVNKTWDLKKYKSAGEVSTFCIPTGCTACYAAPDDPYYGI